MAALPRECRRVRAACATLGCEVFDSDANFFLMRTPRPVAAALAKRGILVRDVSAHHPSLAGCVRVTVGTPAINRRFLRALEAVL